MTRLSLCIPFYRNVQMLAEHYRVWASYPEALNSQIEIVLVDDGSPEPAADVPRPSGLPRLRIFRVHEDLPWHQHGARNLAADRAVGPWLLLTDIDHVLPSTSLGSLLRVLQSADPLDVFTFDRLDAPHLTPKLDRNGHRHPHCNSFAVTKQTFWRVGGYDEDCVGYGTDGYFRKRLFARPAVHLETIPLVRYAREVIADANTPAPHGTDPKLFRDRSRQTGRTRQILQEKETKGLPPTVLNFAWSEVRL